MARAAQEVRLHAWAPYSHFQVGAAILAAGEIFVGCNVENISYPVGMCAERGAIAAMVAAGHREPVAIAIAGGPMITPCGMCRQALVEFSPDLPILMIGSDSGEQVETTLGVLLPSAFQF